MTAPQKPQDGLEILLDALLAEMMSMTDQQVLDGEDPAAVQAKGLTMLSTAKQEAARRRLTAAKAGVAMARAGWRSMPSAKTEVWQIPGIYASSGPVESGYTSCTRTILCCPVFMSIFIVASFATRISAWPFVVSQLSTLTAIGRSLGRLRARPQVS